MRSVKIIAVFLMIVLQGCVAKTIEADDSDPVKGRPVEFNWTLVPIQSGAYVPVVCTDPKTCSATPKKMYEKFIQLLLRSAGV